MKKSEQFSHIRTSFQVYVCDPWFFPGCGIRTFLLAVVPIAPVKGCFALSPTYAVTFLCLSFALIPFPLLSLFLLLFPKMIMDFWVVFKPTCNEATVILERGFFDSHRRLLSSWRDGVSPSR